jgi:hypothetical protein
MYKDPHYLWGGFRPWPPDQSGPGDTCVLRDYYTFTILIVKAVHRQDKGSRTESAAIRSETWLFAPWSLPITSNSAPWQADSTVNLISCLSEPGENSASSGEMYSRHVLTVIAAFVKLQTNLVQAQVTGYSGVSCKPSDPPPACVATMHKDSRLINHSVMLCSMPG